MLRLCRSEDDPFLLVAALKCSAFVLSNDALRQHVAKLKTAEQRRLFYRWQEQKQLRMHSFREARTGGQLKSKLIVSFLDEQETFFFKAISLVPARDL